MQVATMTSGKGNKRKQKTATNDTRNTSTDSVKDAKDESKETSIDHVQDAKDDTKGTSIDHVKDAKDDNKEEEKVNSQHFDPIPAENNRKNMTTVDISK